MTRHIQGRRQRGDINLFAIATNCAYELGCAPLDPALNVGSGVFILSHQSRPRRRPPVIQEDLRGCKTDWLFYYYCYATMMMMKWMLLTNRSVICFSVAVVLLPLSLHRPHPLRRRRFNVNFIMLRNTNSMSTRDKVRWNKEQGGGAARGRTEGLFGVNQSSCCQSVRGFVCQSRLCRSHRNYCLCFTPRRLQRIKQKDFN